MTVRQAPSARSTCKKTFRVVFLSLAAIALADLHASGHPVSAADATASSSGPSRPARNLASLSILGPDYPRVFFFRASEGGPGRRGGVYERWEAEFNRLQGILGKCLDEEVLGREVRNPEFFSRFKQRQPQQVVLLHRATTPNDISPGTGSTVARSASWQMCPPRWARP
jgi:hypothetical protein